MALNAVSRPPPTPQPISLHAVRFYADAAILCRLAGDFLADGLERGEGAIVIATPGHATGMIARLAERDLDPVKLTAQGDLAVLDVAEALSTFMVDELPDQVRFTETITPVIERLARRDLYRRSLRIYGEIVDVLWQAGLERAAVRLEMHWNMLGRSHPFSLLCGYAAGSRYAEGAIEAICGQHSHVLSENGAAARLT